MKHHKLTAFLREEGHMITSLFRGGIRSDLRPGSDLDPASLINQPDQIYQKMDEENTIKKELPVDEKVDKVDKIEHKSCCNATTATIAILVLSFMLVLACSVIFFQGSIISAWIHPHDLAYYQNLEVSYNELIIQSKQAEANHRAYYDKCNKFATTYNNMVIEHKKCQGDFDSHVLAYNQLVDRTNERNSALQVKCQKDADDANRCSVIYNELVVEHGKSTEELKILTSACDERYALMRHDFEELQMEYARAEHLLNERSNFTRTV
mgnify:CR=1 FL=1